MNTNFEKCKTFAIEFKKKITLDKFYYLPFIGWIFPMALRKSDSSAMHHARQGFILFLFFTIILIALSFSMVFIPISARTAKLVIVILIYTFELAYFTMCFIGTLWVKNGKNTFLPFVKKYTELLHI